MIRDLYQQLRVKQWAKNCLLFAGLIFARGAGNPELWVRAVLGFLAFCLASSTTYVLNDWLDRERDRQHPTKRNRPIAAGRISTGGALAILIVLLAATGALSLYLGWNFALVAWSYLILNLLYSLALKRLMILDVLCIASGFVLRAIAGVAVLRPVQPGIELSPWLLVCTFFGALFLGSIKRRQELALVSEGARRHVLRDYNQELLDDLIRISAACTLFAYALYTISPGTVQKFHTEGLVYTIPFVVFGIFRYLYLTRVRAEGESPTDVLLGDRPILVNVALWLALTAVLVYGPWAHQR